MTPERILLDYIMSYYIVLIRNISMDKRDTLKDIGESICRVSKGVDHVARHRVPGYYLHLSWAHQR